MSQDFLIHFNPNLSTGNAKGGKDEKQALRKACQEFESLFTEQLLAVMRKSVPKSDLLGDRKEEDLYMSLFDQELAVQLSKGRGMGLADMLFEQLKQGLHGDSDDKVSSQPRDEQPVSTRKSADRQAGGIPLALDDKKH
jgi:peptidoglycan hydrolase FlgJ